MWRSISCICLVLALCGCMDQPVYQKSFTFQDRTWSQDVKPSFEVEIADTSKAYDFIITLRNGTDFQYSNLWIYLDTKTPKLEHSREPYQIRIADPTGKWIGKKSGSIVENEIVFSRRKMPYPGKYVFTIEQGVIQSKVNEVLDIGFHVQESKIK